MAALLRENASTTWRGNKFHSAAMNLSDIDLDAILATQFTVAAAVALRKAIEVHTQIKPEIKWPNDILISGKKVAGILTELSAELDRIKYVLVGIGVDVNLDPSDFSAELRTQATSLKIEMGKAISRAELAVNILREFDIDYQRVCANDFDEVAEEWEKHCKTIGEEVVIRTGPREIRGRAESLAEDGALLLRTEHGRPERIVGGDVTYEK